MAHRSVLPFIVTLSLFMIACVSGQWKIAQSRVNFRDLFNTTPKNYVSGAVVSVVPHPTDSKITFAVSINGGIWRTDNADASNEELVWKPLTDSTAGSSFGVLTFDRSDTTSKTVYAGPAKLSNFGSRGGELPGLYQSTDLGESWQILNKYRDRHFQDLFVDGDLIIGCHRNVKFNSREDPAELQQQEQEAEVKKRQEEEEKEGFTYGGYSISRNRGQTVVDNEEKVCHSLAYDSATKTIFMGREDAVLYSTDAGRTWTPLTTAAHFAKPEDNDIPGASVKLQNVRLSFTNNRLFILLGYKARGGPKPHPGTLEKIYYVDMMPDTEPTVTKIPTPIVYQDITFPLGSQPTTNLAALGAPDGSYIIVAGTIQPFVNSSNPLKPNGWGANIWKYTIADKTWSPLIYTGGSKSGTSPHSDVRSLAWSLNKDYLLESDDGGIARRSIPLDTTTDWEPWMGNLMVLETHSIDIDPYNDQVVAGAQDNADLLSAPGLGAGHWISVSAGDGGPPKFINDKEDKHWMVGSQNYFMFRASFDSSGTLSNKGSPVTLLIDGKRASLGFRPTWQISPFNTKRFMISDAVNPKTKKASMIETMDSAANLAIVDSYQVALDGNFVFGGKKDGQANEDLLIYRVGSSKTSWSLKRRLNMEDGVSPYGDKLVFQPMSIVADPDDYSRVWVLTGRGGVRYTKAQNPTSEDWESWTTTEMKNQKGNARTILIASDMCDTGSRHLIALTSNAIFVTDLKAESPQTSWRNIATGLPTAVYYDMAITTTPKKLFYLATLGRGVWKLENPSNYICTTPSQTTDVKTSTTSATEDYDYAYGEDDLSDGDSSFFVWGVSSNQTNKNFSISFSVFSGDAYVCISFNDEYEEDPCQDPNDCEYDIAGPVDDEEEPPTANVTCRIPPGATNVYMSVTDYDDEDIGTYYSYEINSPVIANEDEPYIIAAPSPVNGKIDIRFPGVAESPAFIALPVGYSGQAKLENSSVNACLFFASGSVPRIDDRCLKSLSYSTGNSKGYLGIYPLSDGLIPVSITVTTSTSFPSTSSPTTHPTTSPTPTPTPMPTSTRTPSPSPSPSPPPPPSPSPSSPSSPSPSPSQSPSPSPSPSRSTNVVRTIINLNFGGMFGR